MSAAIQPYQMPAALRQMQMAPTLQDQATTPAAPVCSCGKVFNLTCERGEDLKSQITLSVTDKTTGVKSPVDLTGQKLQFTAKPHQDDGSQVPDSDPRVVKVDWQETTTPTQGKTWLQVPAAITQNMAIDPPYDQQVRMVSPSGVVSRVFRGSLVITEPVSARFV
ncbi:MAG TPA: hypothetical protein VFO40_01510 [Chthoniobacterales bacterium]|nr:hypothetical protein [Chthoniobacterales bacterium]